MRLVLPSGRELEIEDARFLGAFAGPAAHADPPAAVREALEHPTGYPPLRRGLTPGDRVALVVDERLPDLAGLLVPILDHINSAGVESGAIAVLCPTTTAQTWVEELPERHEEIHIETHDPKDRRRSSYLATTSTGRRLYLNRTVVDADQVVVLSERRYDLRLGYGGGEGAIYPALSEEESIAHASGIGTEVPGDEPWPLRREAIEVSWLLGQPFYVLAIGSRGGGVAHVVAGAGDACEAARRLLDHSWKPHLPRLAATAILTFSGDPGRRTFAELALAACCAARGVAEQGRIVLLADAAPERGPGGEILLRAGDSRLALAALEKAALPNSSAALLWARAAVHARLSILNAWPNETTEELFATPLTSMAEVQRLVAAGGDCVVLEDAHRMMVVSEASGGA